MQEQDPFADIRPYQDHEVSDVLDRIVRSNTLIKALLNYRMPFLPSWCQSLLLPLARYVLRRSVRQIHTISDFQGRVEQWVGRVLKSTATEVVVRGLDKMSPTDGHLWISNHRDIAMDPTMINYSLRVAGWPTSDIAIGDNLLSHPDIAELMRLNRCFIVKRGLTGKREKLQALQHLSRYIRHSLDSKESVWIAQKEGRAKDGIDETDKAVLKMMSLHGREREETFAETFQNLRPVPVSLQYEWDPCDCMKARELVARRKYGTYTKAEGEDTLSLLTGITGEKGAIHVDFGEPLTDEEMQDADTMALAIDAQIRDMVEILPVHNAALAELQNTYGSHQAYRVGPYNDAVKEKLLARIEQETSDVKQQVLLGYAMPIILQQDAHKE